MVVWLRTSNESAFGDPGTNDAIYIGVFGTSGGREFPLNVMDYNDFEEGLDIYHLGTVWDGSVLTGTIRPIMSEPGEENDPAEFLVELEDIQFVYIRKQARQGDQPSQDDDVDNAYRFGFVEVRLYSVDPQSRTFSARNLWLGHEYGLQAWLSEERPVPPYYSQKLQVGSVGS